MNTSSPTGFTFAEPPRVATCPHCGTGRPVVALAQDFGSRGNRRWAVYSTTCCGGLLLAVGQEGSTGPHAPIEVLYPGAQSAAAEMPDPARRYLQQAMETLHAPDGAVMLAASAIDAMLKAHGYRDGSLNSRINKAADDHLITVDMALWAHHVRLEANDPRHADEDVPHKSPEDAELTVEFATALANILFVLPSRVTRGLKEAGGTPVAEGGKLPETE